MGKLLYPLGWNLHACMLCFLLCVLMRGALFGPVRCCRGVAGGVVVLEDVETATACAWLALCLRPGGSEPLEVSAQPLEPFLSSSYTNR